ncbi:MAG: hypothetical protein Q7O66_01180, partial [Dehalococcoidia bacterium]|nr:hypothetical protein [Dehalococcoidia bacterium]
NRVYSFLNPGEATAKEVWPELLRMYGNFQKAWALADKLNYDDLDYGLPLQIFAWCDDPEKLCTPMTDRGDPNDYAFFHGSNSIDPTGVPRPWISISVDASSARAKDAPDMLEFHEFGHFFQADMMRNALPRDAFVRPHGGMYANESSADAWVEGFASFYATLVAREITVEPFPSQLRIGKQGVMLDMEQNYMAWDGDGALEEFAVTGRLWDFVDGSGDYQRLPKKHNLETRNSSVVDVATEQIMFTGEVVNRDSTTSERTQITMKYVDNPGNVGYISGPTSPEDIPPGGVARFYLPLPKGTFVQKWEFSIEALPVGDDDPLQVEPSELMASIEGFRSEKAFGGGRLFDVQ